MRSKNGTKWTEYENCVHQELSIVGTNLNDAIAIVDSIGGNSKSVSFLFHKNSQTWYWIYKQRPRPTYNLRNRITSCTLLLIGIQFTSAHSTLVHKAISMPLLLWRLENRIIGYPRSEVRDRVCIRATKCRYGIEGWMCLRRHSISLKVPGLHQGSFFFCWAQYVDIKGKQMKWTL